jgi:hypothetical protein
MMNTRSDLRECRRGRTGPVASPPVPQLPASSSTAPPDFEALPHPPATSITVYRGHEFLFPSPQLCRTGAQLLHNDIIHLTHLTAVPQHAVPVPFHIGIPACHSPPSAKPKLGKACALLSCGIFRGPEACLCLATQASIRGPRPWTNCKS